jgi:hypothetical protein
MNELVYAVREYKGEIDDDHVNDEDDAIDENDDDEEDEANSFDDEWLRRLVCIFLRSLVSNTKCFIKFIFTPILNSMNYF